MIVVGRARALLPISRTGVKRSRGLLGEPPLRIGWLPLTEPSLEIGAGAVVMREQCRHGAADHVAAVVHGAATLADVAESPAGWQCFEVRVHGARHGADR